MVVLKGYNTEHLKDLRKEAEDVKLHTYIVTDAGRTQVSVRTLRSA